jgi:hypothetical protein
MFTQILNETSSLEELAKSLWKPGFVFLGGTTASTEWRNVIIPKLTIEYFNPIVEDWKPEDEAIELQKRKDAGIVLYVISPKMKGVYSIAEVIDDSNKRPSSTVFSYMTKDGNASFDDQQIRSMNAVGKMVLRNGGKWLDTMDEVVQYLNTGLIPLTQLTKLSKLEKG